MFKSWVEKLIGLAKTNCPKYNFRAHLGHKQYSSRPNAMYEHRRFRAFCLQINGDYKKSVEIINNVNLCHNYILCGRTSHERLLLLFDRFVARDLNNITSQTKSEKMMVYKKFMYTFFIAGREKHKS